MGLTSFAFSCMSERMRRKTAWKLLKRTSRMMRAYQTEEFLEREGDTVQAGPFAGMVLPPDAMGADYQGALLPMLLGVFEQEIAGAIGQMVARAPGLVVNVGAAEGYYAVGFARALPDARVVGYEILEPAHEVCRRLAKANGVSVELRGECTVAELNGVLDRPAALIVDCEGGEMQLLDPQAVPALTQCDILVECHDMYAPGATQAMIDRFGVSHDIERIEEGDRPMAVHDAFRGRSSLERMIAVCEFRGNESNWLMLTAKRPAG